jgi:dinuclear metal center YbgI/SA1388 family protein
MATVDVVTAKLEELAPLPGAEGWDNVGLLVGDRQREVRQLMTCLTMTPATVGEAVARRVDLVVVHHPLPFRPLARLTTDTTTGRLLWNLIGAGVSVFSAHTAFDSAPDGINAQWSAKLGLCEIQCLVDAAEGAQNGVVGAGRCGRLPSPLKLSDFARHVPTRLPITKVRIVGDDALRVSRVAVACGSGGSFLDAARAKGCDCLVTGETNFHTCLEAEASRIGLVLCGHYASERFAMEQLAARLGQLFPEIEVWASREERDPVREL